ncbi:MAG: phosphoribosylamine--glycine ligase [Candidatus Eisenbacteria bacterium]|nr:phosphoribosylamine--glycine ligase [Candidatus Eisenbacteria bacterium]
MKVLVVGGGGREHALVWKLAQSPTVSGIIAAPGNAGIARLAETTPIPAHDIEGLVRLAEERECGLTVVGPEVPLTLGIVDAFRARGLTAFGPTRAAARIEGSKSFAKELMRRAGVPTASARTCTSREEAAAAAGEIGYPVVIKADGLAAGKGVVIAADGHEAETAIDDAMVRQRFGRSGDTLVVEECLRGEEASILAITDGRKAALLAPSQDHKRALDGDRGPNTGGMGAYAPAPVVSEETLADVERSIIGPTLEGLAEMEGAEYRGVLYAGLMMTDGGPKVVEFNCRFGDPETQVTLPLLEGDLAEIMMSAASGDLDPSAVGARPRHAVCVVMASGGYPGQYEKGKLVEGIDSAEAMNDVVVFHAGTRLEDGATVTSGGRVLGVTAWDASLADAVKRAYRAVDSISFENEYHRTDIAHRALSRQNTGQGTGP